MSRHPRSERPVWRPVLAAGFAVLALGACTEAPAERPRPQTSVILVSIDTLRPDHLGCYGYARPVSPAIDAFCGDGVVFREAIAQAPSTLHSHASMLSSLLPQHHNASWDARTRLAEETITLAEVLRDAGYRTAAFTGGGQMDRIFGLDQGFDLYHQPKQERFAGTVSEALAWIDEQAGETFFLFLHTYEPHHPYDPQPEDLAALGVDYRGSLPREIGVDLLRRINRGDLQLEPGDLDYIVAAYDADIRSMDRGFKMLVDSLRERGLYDNTLIVFTSDHGEEFNEHGRVGWHSHTLFDELLRVPLVFKLPAGRHAGSVVTEQVRSVDIPSTVLALVGIEAPSDFLGVDLTPWMAGAGDGPLPPAVSRQDRRPGREIASIREGRWKLLGPDRERKLFDIDSDPGERWDVTRPDVSRRLEEELERMIAARHRLDPPRVAPTEATREELRALGYIQ